MNANFTTDIANGVATAKVILMFKGNRFVTHGMLAGHFDLLITSCTTTITGKTLMIIRC